MSRNSIGSLISSPNHLLAQASEGSNLPSIELRPVKHASEEMISTSFSYVIGIAYVVKGLKKVFI